MDFDLAQIGKLKKQRSRVSSGKENFPVRTKADLVSRGSAGRNLLGLCLASGLFHIREKGEYGREHLGLQRQRRVGVRAAQLQEHGTAIAGLEGGVDQFGSRFQLLVADPIEDIFDMMHKVRQPAEAGACARAFQGVHGAENAVYHLRVAGVEFEKQERAAEIGKQIVRLMTEGLL